MKLWHDDVRAPPDSSWIWARTNEEARRLLSKADAPPVTHISLDHDLGLDELDVPEDADDYWDQLIQLAHVARDRNSETGLDLVNWMIEHKCVPEHVTIHSWNPGGAQMMAARLNYCGYDCVVEPFKMKKEKS